MGVVFWLSQTHLVLAATDLKPITNHAIGNLGNNAAQAASGQLLLQQFVKFWGNATTLGALLTIGYFILGAFEWITSEGDSGKLQKARNKMLHAAIGLLILVSAFIIIGFISALFFGNNFDILNLNFIFPNAPSVPGSAHTGLPATTPTPIVKPI